MGDAWGVPVGLLWAGGIQPVSGLKNTKAVLARSEQAAGRGLRAHVRSQAMRLWLCSLWR